MAGFKIILILLLISGFQALLGFFVLVGFGIGIHDTHVVNNVRPLHQEVSTEETPLNLPLVFRREPFEFVLPFTHGATYEYFGVVTQVLGGEVLDLKVGNPITELFVTSRDEDPLLGVEGVADGKYCSTYIAMVQQVMGIDTIAQELGINPLLHP